MGRAKKTRKYAATKRVLNPNDDRLKLKAAAKAEAAPIVHRESDKKKGAADASVQRSELFFSHNRALGPPFHVRWVRLVFGVGWEEWVGRSRLGEHCLVLCSGPLACAAQRVAFVAAREPAGPVSPSPARASSCGLAARQHADAMALPEDVGFSLPARSVLVMGCISVFWTFLFPYRCIVYT